MAPRTDAVPIDAKTNREGDPTEGGGGERGSEDATPAKKPKKAAAKPAKPKTKDPNAVTLAGSDGEGRYFYSPCDLTMIDPKTNEEVLVQDWVVVQLPPAVEGGPKRFECRKRTDLVTLVAALPPYPPTTQEGWDSKTSAVRDAMVHMYVEYNFRPFLDALKERGGDDQSEFKAANTFCYEEAARLVPKWEDATNRYGSEMTTPVQFEPSKPNDARQNSRFDPTNNREPRVRAYDWSTSPLMINNFAFAKERFKAAFKTPPFNLNNAIPTHSRMFPGPEHEAIQRGMLRKPSKMLKGDGSPAQPWAYNKDANQMVEHAVYDPEDGMRASDDQLEGFRREFDATRQLMIKAFLEKWFPSDDETGDVDGVETTFGAWCKANDFDPRNEAQAMVPAFNDDYGFQHYPPQTAPGSSMPKKKQYVAETAYDWKAEDGFAGVSTRFANLNKAVTVEGTNGKPGKKVFIGTPIDLLWVGDPNEFYDRYKAAAKPTKAKKENKPRKKAAREKPAKKTDGVAELVSLIPPETYLKLLVQTYIDRRARETAHGAELDNIRKSLAGKDQAFQRNQKLEAKREEHKQKEDQERQRENAALAEQKKRMLQKTNILTLSAQISQEEIELLQQLTTDEQRFTYLRMKYHIDLKIIDERIRNQPKEKKRLKTQTDKVLEQFAQNNDEDVPAETAVPSDEMAVDSSPAYSSSDERVGAYEREEIRFAYLASIKRVLEDKAKAEEIYNGEIEIMTKKKKKAQRDKFIADAALNPEQRETDRKVREANAKAAKRKETPRKPKVPYDQMDFYDKMKEDANKREKLRRTYSTRPAAQKQYDVYVGLFKEGMFSESDTAKLARENGLYSELYADWKNTKSQRERNTFHTMAKAVLQYFYTDFDEYREQKRDAELTPEERRKEAENREAKKEQDAYKKAVRTGDKRTAMYYVEKDRTATVEADEQDRKDSIEHIVDEYNKKLSDINADEALFATFDSGAFANELMKKLTQVQNNYEIVRKNTFHKYTNTEAKVNELPESEVAKRKQEFEERLKESAATRVRTLLKEKSIAELVGEDAAVLLARAEERKQSTKETQAKRQALLVEIYSDVIKAGVENPDQQDVAMRVAVASDKNGIKIQQLEAMEESAKREKEKLDYKQNAALRSNALLASFNRFLLDVQKYNAMNSSETLQPLFEAGELTRKPEALKEGLTIETVAASILSPELLKALPKLPVLKKPQPKPRSHYVEDALAWQSEQVERKWYQKDRADRAGKGGLDPLDPQDALDLEYMYEDTASYEGGVTSLDKNMEAKLDLERLWEVLGNKKSKEEFLADSRAAFIREQNVNYKAGISTLEDNIANIVDFLVTKRVGFSTSAKKFWMGGRARMQYFSISAFQGRDKIGFANSRLEPFMKPDENGKWRVVMYDVDEIEEDDGDQFKRSNVLHFYEDDLEAIPKNVWDPTMDRVYENFDPSSGDKRYSIYQPPDGEVDPEGAKAWDAAVKAYEFARESISIEDFVVDGIRTKEQAIATVKEYADMGLLTWDPLKETISNIKLPDDFKSTGSDSADDKVAKAVMLKKYAELRAFMAENYKNTYDEEDTAVVILDGSAPGGASDEEEEKSDEEEEKSDYEEEEEQEEEQDEEEEESDDDDDDADTPAKPSAFGAISDDDGDDSDSDESDAGYDPGVPGSDPGSGSEDEDDDGDYFDEDAEQDEEDDDGEDREEGGEEEDSDDDVSADSTDDDGDAPKPLKKAAKKAAAGEKRKQVPSVTARTPSVSDEVVDSLTPAFQRSAALHNTGQRQWWGNSTAWWKPGY